MTRSVRRLDSGDHPVDPTVIGRTVDVTADLQRGCVVIGHRLEASDSRRPRPALAPRETTVTDPAHLAARRAAATAVPRTPHDPKPLQLTGVLTGGMVRGLPGYTGHSVGLTDGVDTPGSTGRPGDAVA